MASEERPVIAPITPAGKKLYELSPEDRDKLIDYMLADKSEEYSDWPKEEEKEAYDSDSDSDDEKEDEDARNQKAEKKEREKITTFIKSLDEKDINELLPNGDTLFILALKHKDFELAQSLMKEGANPNQVNQKGEHPLFYAEDLVTADRIIQSGTDLRKSEPGGYSGMGRRYNVFLKNFIDSANWLAKDKTDFTPSFFELDSERRRILGVKTQWDRPGFAQMAAMAKALYEGKDKELRLGSKILNDKYRIHEEYGRSASTLWANMAKLGPLASAEIRRRQAEKQKEETAELLQIRIVGLEAELAEQRALMRALADKMGVKVEEKGKKEVKSEPPPSYAPAKSAAISSAFDMARNKLGAGPEEVKRKEEAPPASRPSGSSRRGRGLI